MDDSYIKVTGLEPIDRVLPELKAPSLIVILLSIESATRCRQHHPRLLTSFDHYSGTVGLARFMRDRESLERAARAEDEHRTVLITLDNPQSSYDDIMRAAHMLVTVKVTSDGRLIVRCGEQILSCTWMSSRWAIAELQDTMPFKVVRDSYRPGSLRHVQQLINTHGAHIQLIQVGDASVAQVELDTVPDQWSKLDTFVLAAAYIGPDGVLCSYKTATVTRGTLNLSEAAFAWLSDRIHDCAAEIKRVYLQDDQPLEVLE